MKQDDLIRLKSLLPKDFASRLALSNNVSPGYVRKVLKGKVNRLDIVDSAILLAQEHQEKLKMRSARISNI